MTSPRTHSNPATAAGYALRGELDKALADLCRAQELNPADANIYSIRGTIYDGLGSHENALADFDRAISIKPDYVDIFGVVAEEGLFK
ncbi:hypothetical protein R80B4_01845 [Fibrobacteres bacterium R8-0-B4]